MLPLVHQLGSRRVRHRPRSAVSFQNHSAVYAPPREPSAVPESCSEPERRRARLLVSPGQKRKEEPSSDKLVEATSIANRTEFRVNSRGGQNRLYAFPTVPDRGIVLQIECPLRAVGAVQRNVTGISWNCRVTLTGRSLQSAAPPSSIPARQRPISRFKPPFEAASP